MEFEFKNLSDLIDCVKKYKYRKKRPRNQSTGHSLRPQLTNEYTLPFNLDMESLVDCLIPLEKINNLIGMDELKKNIIDQVLFFSQNLNSNEMMHTCLTGPPGVGKTTLGKILAELYCCMGFLKTDKFKLVTSADLIGGYLGQTALKTKKLLKESLGGVLFIDEAYSLGSGDEDRGNSYSKECIDTITQFLSEHTSNFIMIIAGYHNELERCFFSMNAGLRRRFPWTYDIKNYSINNLREIFVYQVSNNNWSLDPSLTESNLDNLFKEYPDIFKNNGGDTLTLFDKAKICHSRRVFGKKSKTKRILNIVDIRLALELLKSHNRKVKPTEPPFGMYT